MSKTELLYLADTWQFDATANVLSVTETELPKGVKSTAVVLDKTIFHSQGGGQPSDVGTIESGGTAFDVESVKKNGDEVLHLGKFRSSSSFEHGQAVKLTINADRTLPALAALVPTKGDHRPENPYVSYDGSVDDALRPALIAALQAELAALVLEGIPTVVRTIKGADVDPTYAGTGFPKGEDVRVVGVAGDLLCPCGGTHVKNSSELGAVCVTKITTKKNETKVFYQLGDALSADKPEGAKSAGGSAAKDPKACDASALAKQLEAIRFANKRKDEQIVSLQQQVGAALRSL